MSRAELIDAIDGLPLDEKLSLLEEIWGRIAAEPDSLPTPPEHVRELRRRLEEHDESPDDVVSWAEMRASMRSVR